jgi:flagellar motor switch protein FliG
MERAKITSLDELSGPEKAAVVILALGDAAEPLLALMDEEEIKDVSHAMSHLGLVQASVVEDLLVDFVKKLSGSGALVGSYEATQRLLLNFLPAEKVDTLMEEIRGPAGRTMWDKLHNVNEVVLANYLKNEYPQTVAVILSRLKAEHAAKVLTELPDEFAVECVLRMLRMQPVQRDILDKIEITLRNEFMSNLARTSRRDSHELMADIFNNLDRQTEGRFLSALEERHRDSADRIRALMFVFDDLRKLDPAGVQTLLRVVPKDVLGLALKGASDDLRQMFIGAMSERAAKLLRDDMAAMGPVRLKDVDAAQAQMVVTAKDLATRGEIVLSENSAEDELIY